MDDRAKETLLNEALDLALDRFHMADVSDDAFDKVFEVLFGELRELKNLFNAQDGVGFSDRNWKRLMENVSGHPLMRILRTDPFTGRVLPSNRHRGHNLVEEDEMFVAHHERPRSISTSFTSPPIGSTGIDRTSMTSPSLAAMDPISLTPAHDEEHDVTKESVVTNFGRRLWLCGPTRPNIEDIKLRHEQIGKFIDRQFDSRANPLEPFRLLSVPCGRCRHVRTSRVFAEKKIDAFVAMDPDGLTLDNIDSRFPQAHNISTVRGGVDLFLTNNLPPVVAEYPFDVVVCTDRFEYLSRSMCARVIESLWRVVRPGGILIFSNLRRVSDLSALGTRTLQLLPHWGLVRRSLHDLRELSFSIPKAQLEGGRSAIDLKNDATYVYAVIRKSSSDPGFSASDLSSVAKPPVDEDGFLTPR